ncbi:hypothetical protein NP233_g405 [Leucocoprinus birnbaumii]|uniref:Uncharacterized protein n=1 Tax=Leucocoprinus birnbaumii TaxID=56174 RepID=A0AAD5W276_9AGAR|nr:hypothetical protein NP233_g405 [Leucocoprinus birnbaumii]
MSVSSKPGPRPESSPGSVLVSEVIVKKSKKLADWVKEGFDEWLPGQTSFSQSQGPTCSQGPTHPMARRKRIRAKQLEKVKEAKKPEEDEEATKVVLDDLIKFDGKGGSTGLAQGSGDGRQVGNRGSGLELLMKGRSEPEGVRKAWLSKEVERGMIMRQEIDLLKVDLSRPQPMVVLKGLADPQDPYPEMARGPKGITFEVMKRKMDTLEMMKEKAIDPARLLHDLTL